MSKQSFHSQSSHEDSDPSIFAWPQTTLTCVSRRNTLHASSPSVFSKIGGVSLRYSHAAKGYVIDGRKKTGEDAKSKARNTIRSHYRWAPKDISHPPNNIEVDKDANKAAQPVQQARKEDNTKWNHTRIKKLRKFAAERRTQIISTPNLTVKESNSPASSSHENSANEPLFEADYEGACVNLLQLDVGNEDPTERDDDTDESDDQFQSKIDRILSNEKDDVQNYDEFDMNGISALIKQKRETDDLVLSKGLIDAKLQETKEKLSDTMDGMMQLQRNNDELHEKVQRLETILSKKDKKA